MFIFTGNYILFNQICSSAIYGGNFDPVLIDLSIAESQQNNDMIFKIDYLI